jgi:two-component system OmpR family response regulator
MPLLLIEDDLEAARLLIKSLNEQGYEVEHAADGRVGLDLALKRSWDLIIADRMLPHIDGLTVVQTLRGHGRKTPVLILSALAEVDDRVRGLKAGGDDYLTKPYAAVELQARVEALLRRSSQSAETRLKTADLEIDLMSRVARRSGKEIALTQREFDLLTFLMQRAGQVVTRKMLLEHVWDLHFDPQTNVIDVHMSRLRQAVDKGFDTPLIHTVRGAGYMFGMKA